MSRNLRPGYGMFLAAWMVLVPPGAATGQVRGVTVQSLQVDNLTGLSLDVGSIDSTLRVVLDVPELLRFRGDPNIKSSIGVPTVDVLLNPFTSASGEDSLIPAALRVVVERLEYTFRIDPKGDLAAFWAFGIVGAGLRNEDVVAGVVQLRAVLHRLDTGQSLVSASLGIAAGDYREFSRGDALKLAARRSAWNLVDDLGFKANLEWNLGLKPRGRTMTAAEYRARIDGQLVD